MEKPDRRGIVTSESLSPVAFINGKWRQPGSHALCRLRNPSHWKKEIGRVPLASPADVKAAAAAAKSAGPKWANAPEKTRKKLLLDWASRLLDFKAPFAAAMALEIGKPVSLAEEEVMFAVRLLLEAVRLPENAETGSDADFPRRGDFAVRRGPLGVVGLITPWNNPLAIPVGKIAPALLFGNSVVWKPAALAPRTSILVLETLRKAACPEGVVNLTFGEKDTAHHLVLNPDVRAVSFTGSWKSGLEVARLCSSRPIPVQLELGGNNASLIMPDGDIEEAARTLAVSAFSFSGQRCTAPRRFIVHRAVRRIFEEALVAAVRSLRIGLPSDRETQVGPLISRRKQKEMEALVQKSVGAGAKILCGGSIPARWKEGCWFEPTVLASVDPELPVVQEESFGPVAVLETARDIHRAIRLLNAVPQGLVASLFSKDPSCQRLFLEKAECGVLKLNQTTLGVRPEAPFGGWKASGLGPFEHGCSDREFYTRIQTLYG